MTIDAKQLRVCKYVHLNKESSGWTVLCLNFIKNAQNKKAHSKQPIKLNLQCLVQAAQLLLQQLGIERHL